MKRRSYTFFIAVFLASGIVCAQDTTKKVTHEIGFNTVSLVKQLISNNPSETLGQLPYDVFYNMYFKNTFGIRLGLGIQNRHSKVEIEGQADPRTTSGNILHLRGGVSNNFLSNRRLTLNVFGDLLYSQDKSTTVNTHTVQNFGDPVEEIETTTTDDAVGLGAQIGVGVKFNLLKNLALYAEVPLSFISTKVESTVLIRQPFVPEINSKAESTNTSTSIFLPTTVYLVLMF